MFDNGRDNHRIAETDLMSIVAMKIQIMSALNIRNGAALAGREYVQAGGGQGLAQKILFISSQPLAGFRVDLISIPLPAKKRLVAVAF